MSVVLTQDGNSLNIQIRGAKMRQLEDGSLLLDLTGHDQDHDVASSSGDSADPEQVVPSFNPSEDSDRQSAESGMARYDEETVLSPAASRPAPASVRASAGSRGSVASRPAPARGSVASRVAGSVRGSARGSRAPSQSSSSSQ